MKKRTKTKVTKTTAIWWWKYILSRARQIDKWNPLKRASINDAKGFCAGCKTGGHEDLESDHIDPVVPVNQPFAGDWNTFFHRLFYGKRQALCRKCHLAKSNEEKKKRKAYRDSLKNLA